MLDDVHAVWRINLAHKLAERIRTFQGVQAIMIAGSVARGYADEYSDIEIPIFWNSLPDGSKRIEIVRDLNGRFLHSYDGPSAEDQILINDVQVDLWHISVAHEEAVIQAVLKDHKIDEGSLNALDTLRSCIPLYGHEIVAKWKEQAQAFPEGLQKKMIEAHINAFYISGLFLSSSRNNPTALFGQISRLHQDIFIVLLALNQFYFPTYKWLYRRLGEMTIKPVKIEERMRRVFALPYSQAIDETKKLLDETLVLVESHIPSIDTTQVRQQLGYIRTAQWRSVSY